MAFGTQPDDAGNVPLSSVYSKENNTFPALAAEPGAYKDANSNQSSAAVMSFMRPLVVQKAHNVTGSGVKTLTCAFTGNNIGGNSIVIAMGMGEVEAAGITLAITDTTGNTYAQADKASQSTTLEATIFYTTNIAAGANTVTITIAGGSSSNTAIGVEIYEVWGLIAVSEALDQTGIGNSSGSTALTTTTLFPSVPNELFIAAISAAGGTITAATSWTLDSTSLSPTGGNLVSFGVESRSHSIIAPLTPSATLSGSNAWAMAAASFKSIVVPIGGTVSVLDGIKYSQLGQAYSATAFQQVGASGTGWFGISVFNPATSGKTIQVYSIKGFNAGTGGGQFYLFKDTSDPALGTVLTPVNQLFGGAASVLSSSVSWNTSSISFPGSTSIDSCGAPQSALVEMLTNNGVILLPAGSAFGLEFVTFVNNSTSYGLTMKWIEL